MIGEVQSIEESGDRELYCCTMVYTNGHCSGIEAVISSLSIIQCYSDSDRVVTTLLQASQNVYCRTRTNISYAIVYVKWTVSVGVGDGVVSGSQTISQ